MSTETSSNTQKQIILRSNLYGKTKTFVVQPNTTVEDIKNQLLAGFLDIKLPGDITLKYNGSPLASGAVISTLDIPSGATFDVSCKTHLKSISKGKAANDLDLNKLVVGSSQPDPNLGPGSNSSSPSTSFNEESSEVDSSSEPVEDAAQPADDSSESLAKGEPMVISSDSESEVQQVDPPIKKKRGRPRKIPEESPKVTPPKKRGRPRKTPEVETPKTPVKEKEITQDTPKRGRGRPPKVVVSPSKDEEPKETEKKKKKSKSKEKEPKETKQLTTNEAEEEEEPSKVEETESSQPAVTPKRGRGRPPKTTPIQEPPKKKLKTDISKKTPVFIWLAGMEKHNADFKQLVEPLDAKGLILGRKWGRQNETVISREQLQVWPLTDRENPGCEVKVIGRNPITFGLTPDDEQTLSVVSTSTFCVVCSFFL